MDRPSNAPFELENQFLLRLPPDAATKLNEVLLAGNLKDRLTLSLHDDLRHGAVKLDGDTYSGKVWDLPCVTECQKTVDMKTFYKTNDLCHMLVCTPDPDLSEHNANIQQNSKLSYPRERKFLWPHGITPPLKNVRKRRFRKTARKKYIDSPDIEKEVKRLLKADIEAVNVRYEVINEEEKSDDKSKMSDSNEASQTQSLETDELHKIFQDLSSSDSENDINVEEVDKEDSFDSVEIPSGVTVVTNEGERLRLNAKLNQLLNEVSELKNRKARNEQIIKGGQLTNEMLVAKFQGELEVIRSRIMADLKEIAMTKARLGIQ